MGRFEKKINKKLNEQVEDFDEWYGKNKSQLGGFDKGEKQANGNTAVKIRKILLPIGAVACAFVLIVAVWLGIMLSRNNSDFTFNDNDIAYSAMTDEEISTLSAEYSFITKMDVQSCTELLYSEECVELLKEADIVVTNPPFSLFREYIAQLIEYEKKFLIVGKIDAITYKEVFPLIKNDKMWCGYSVGHYWYKVPHYYEEKNASCYHT